MKITLISDTHGDHDKLGTLRGDVLIHCGDMFNFSDKGGEPVRQMDAWFGKQDFKLILCTGGNHDFALESSLLAGPSPFKNAIFLQDQSFTHEGVVFYGAPWVPMLKSWAFYATDDELREKWSLIPKNTDVLITHTPPFSTLDRTSRGSRVGCKHLAHAVKAVAPKVHCFGHVHASAGRVDTDSTVFVNASSLYSDLIRVREPVVVEILPPIAGSDL